MLAVRVLSTIIFVVTIQASPTKRATELALSVVHINDFHARFDETNEDAGSCRAGASCIGGFSRMSRQIMDIMEEKPDSLLFDSGDDFQGTVWYSLGKWNVTQQFMNTLPFTASVLGNHEFDDGIDGVVPYIKSLRHPVVVSNIDDSLEPTIQGTYNKSIVVERGGKKIGIIGVIISTCDKISSTGNLKFYPESSSVNAEAERLVREEGVFTNIVISHSGYDIEQAMAANASEKISLIVGAHSHTFLFTGDNPPGPDVVSGPYPTIVKSKYGHDVLVTQASAFSKYVGNITIYLDENGEIADYSGAPIYLDTDHPKNPEINQELLPWKSLIDSQGTVVIGSSLVTLSRTGCYYRECTLGNFVTDAMVYAYTKNAEEGAWTYAAIAITNPGGLRNVIEIGDITYSDMVTAQPFENTINVAEIEGKYIRMLFEEDVLKSYSNGHYYSSMKLLQVSGIKVVYNLTRPEGQRVQSLKIRCQACQIPVYENLNETQIYRIIVSSFISGGGDAYTSLTDNFLNLDIGPLDMDVFRDYLQHRSPVFQEEDERVIVYGEDNIVVKNMDS